VIYDFGWPHAGSERKRDDAPCGGPRDEIERVSDRDAEILFESREDVRSEQSLRSTTVERKNLESVIRHGRASPYPCAGFTHS